MKLAEGKGPQEPNKNLPAKKNDYRSEEDISRIRSESHVIEFEDRKNINGQVDNKL